MANEREQSVAPGHNRDVEGEVWVEDVLVHRPHQYRIATAFRERWAKRQQRRRAEQAAMLVAWRAGFEPPDPDQPLTAKLDMLNFRLNQLRVAEYIAMYENPRRMFWVNLVSGMGRGLGYGIGLGLLTGLIIYLLQRLIAAHLPYLSDWLATIVQLVNRKTRP
jgi:hypothetical protein